MDYFDILLAKKLRGGGGGDITIKSLNVTQNGTYSEEGVAYSPVKVNVPLPENAYLLKDIPNTPTAIATFTDGSDLPMPKLEVGIEPVQDLHGYDAPWVGGAGKNKLNIPDVTTSQNGVSISVKNGVITLNGTVTDSPLNYVFVKGLDLSSTQYTFSGGNQLPNEVYFSVQTSDGNKTLVTNIPTITFTASISGQCWIYAGVGKVFNNVIIKPQIEEGSSATSFAPYSNICPIIGWDEVNVTRCGKNLWDNEWTHYTQPSDYRICPIKLKNGQYTASVKLKEGGTRQSGFTLGIAKQGDRYSNFGSFYTASTGADKTGTITVDDAWTSPKLIIYCNNETAFNAIFENYEIQLEEGTTPTTYEPYAGTTYTIDLDGTRYGGKVDVVSGVMTVDRAMVDLGTLTWGKSSTEATVLYTGITGKKTGVSPMICDRYKYVRDKGFALDFGSVSDSSNASYVGTTFIRNSDFAGKTAVECATLLSGTQLVYELATPLTIQLTPTVVKSLRGVNNVFADSGNILDLSYLAKEE